MRAQRYLRLGLGLFAAAALSGCGGVSTMGPGGASPGFVFAENVYPNAQGPAQHHEVQTLNRGDIELIGPRSAAAESLCVTVRFFASYTSGAYYVSGGGEMRALSFGDSGYGNIVEVMRDGYNADGFLNKTIDSRLWAVDLLLVRVDKVHTTATGLGYRVKPERRAEVPGPPRPTLATARH